MSTAPIIVFAYKRPGHLQRTLRSLAANELASESVLHVFCDGPGPEASRADTVNIERVRATARAANGFKAVHVIAAEKNKGLARSVIDGLDALLKDNESVIVVEDDVDLSPHFLRFMNDALHTFATDKDVAAVGSWTYFTGASAFEKNFFLRFPDSIAWATWRRAWARFQPDGRALKEELRTSGRKSALDLDGDVPYFTDMLDRQINGDVDSWAIRWTASNVLHGGLTYFPKRSLSKHVGFGEDATHETGADDYNKDLSLAQEPLSVDRIPIMESEQALAAWKGFVQDRFLGSSDTSIKTRVWRALPTGLRQWYARRKAGDRARPDALAFAPVSRVFGFDRGTPVDRYYIETFLDKQRNVVSGHVMEIAETTYTQRFGTNVTKAEALVHEGGATSSTRTGDLTRPDTLPVGELDAFICTQTLNFIFDVAQAVRGLHAALKPGGHALVTVAGLVQISRFDADRWGDFWRFTPQGAERLFADVFGKGNVEVGVLGNSYASACLQKGFALEECDQELLDRPDADYPVVITIKARKA